MSKNDKKEYVALEVKDYHILGINDRLGFTTRKQLHNSGLLLDRCVKAEEKHKKTQIGENYQIDFTLLCGKVSFFVEKEAAIDILAYQSKLYAEVKKARKESDLAFSKYGESKQYRLADKKCDRLWFGMPEEVLSYIVRNHPESISSYAYVDFYDIVDYSGSYYYSEGEEDCVTGKSFAKGTIKVEYFLEGLKKAGFIEGINATDPSISNPIEFMRQSLKDGSNSYFGFAIPHTEKALKNPRKTSK